METTSGRRLRVARVIARLNVGGPARHVVWLTAALSAPEFESILVTGRVPPGEEEMGYFAEAHGVHPVVIKEMSREVSPADVITAWKLYRLFTRFRPDIIHTHTAKAGTVGRIAAMMYRWLTLSTLAGRPRRCHVVHTYHGHVFHSYYGRLKTRIFLAIERTLARLATDRIFVLSPQQLDEIHRVFGVGREAQFRIVPLGIDTSELKKPSESARTLRTALAIADDDLVVGIVGRLTAIKNHDLFLTVSARLLASAATRANVRFVVYGDGADRAALERRAQSLGVSGHVIFAGTREPADIYASLDVVALTSLNEGTPLTLLEAMAIGKPIVSTAVGGVVDLLGSVQERQARYEVRERGITVASGDEVGFTDGLARLLLDAALRERLARAGKPFVEAEFSKDRLVADIIRLYRELPVKNY